MRRITAMSAMKTDGDFCYDVVAALTGATQRAARAAWSI
jgi:hypothetical protein